MRVLVNVTQKDIDKGKKRGWTCCPIALALLRTVQAEPGHICVEQEYCHVTFKDKGVLRTKYAYLSFKLQKFIGRFDNDLPVKPGVFSINLKEELE